MAVPGLRVNPVGVLVLGAFAVFGVLYTTGFISFSRTQRVLQDEEVDLKELLSVSIHLAELAGAKVAELKSSSQLNPVQKSTTLEGVPEFVTQGDKASQAVIKKGFASLYPQLQVKSEEHDEGILVDVKNLDKSRPEVHKLVSYRVPVKDLTIWVDPLDATKEYGESTGPEDKHKYVMVMICVAHQGIPVIGVMHRPLENNEYKVETVWGWQGRGVSENLKVTSNSDTPPKIIISMSHAGEVEKNVKRAFGSDAAVILAAGSGYKVLEVCRGKASAYVHMTDIKKWDVCAGNAIIAAAGGNMTTLKGSPLDYSFAGDALIKEGLLATMSSHSQRLQEWSKLAEDASAP